MDYRMSWSSRIKTMKTLTTVMVKCVYAHTHTHTHTHTHVRAVWKLMQCLLAKI